MTVKIEFATVLELGRLGQVRRPDQLNKVETERMMDGWMDDERGMWKRAGDHKVNGEMSDVQKETSMKKERVKGAKKTFPQ